MHHRSRSVNGQRFLENSQTIAAVNTTKINLDFMSFPVFNVADCFITCGCILLLVHLVLFNKEFWKEEKK